jgi:hypothetical protein
VGLRLRVENAQVAAYLAYVARTLDACGAPLDGHVGHAAPASANRSATLPAGTCPATTWMTVLEAGYHRLPWLLYQIGC